MDRSRHREIDALAACEDKVIVVEAKMSPSMSDLEKFVAFVESGEFFEFFPEHRGRRLIPIFASLYLDESFVNYLTKKGIHAMGWEKRP